MGYCKACKRESELIAKSIGLCLTCIRNRIEDPLEEYRRIHSPSRQEYELPIDIPQSKDGLKCKICGNSCSLGEGEFGYCGLRKNENNILVGPKASKANLSYYFDPLPTNCVASWVCAGCSHYGYPDHSYSSSAEHGYYNMAVFFHGCSFNCLFCQNWHFRDGIKNPKWYSLEELLAGLNSRVSCICFFGGDPGPQMDFCINFSHKALLDKKGKFLRICWETNGNISSKFIDEMIDIAFKSGGCIKFDLKAFDPKLHLILTGRENKKTLENFSYIARFVEKRKKLPLLIASSLLIPGYIDEEEIYQIAKFIADLNPEIPYSLLAFYPQYYLSDLPITDRELAFRCLASAQKAGLQNVRLGNIHLLNC